MPGYITDLPKKAFKRVLFKLLFDISEMEDDYVDIPLIIKKKTIGYLLHLLMVLIPAFLVLMHCSPVRAVNQ